MNLTDKSSDNEKFLSFILEKFQIERKRFDCSGVYAFTQRLLAYNSNKIEGSTLTEEQTAYSIYLILVLYLSQKNITEPKMLRK